ncbi:hypothetical protein VTP01DRAFT_7275 [Rhizomucor pusillus]|uniref:uncharacterized protein n=1 Tax=Rhizomucor pusillus TaxID=4840 RepID=UPI00374214EC
MSYSGIPVVRSTGVEPAIVENSHRLKEQLAERQHNHGRTEGDPDLSNVVAAMQRYIRELHEDAKRPYWTDDFVGESEKSAKISEREGKYQRAPEGAGASQEGAQQRVHGMFLVRKAAYKANKADIDRDFEGVEELLCPKFISDEEDVTDEVDNRRTARKVLRLTWRSEEANRLLERLSTLADKQKAEKSKRVRPEKPCMVIEDVEVYPPNLPRCWAKPDRLSPSLRFE